MEILLTFVGGFVTGIGVTFLIARNNQKKFSNALGINPKAKWSEILKELKEKLS